MDRTKSIRTANEDAVKCRDKKLCEKSKINIEANQFLNNVIELCNFLNSIGIK